MKFLWLMLLDVMAILIKENFCVPAIRPLSQRGIIFPVDDWDNCHLDDASTRPGLCKKLEECPDVLNKWDKENVYPKTCYFMKEQQFVCCPVPASEKIENFFNKNTANVTENPNNSLFDIFNTEPGFSTLSQESKEVVSTTVYRPSNIFLDKVYNKSTTSQKPLNSYLDRTTTSTKKPSNIFLDKVHNKTTTIQKPLDSYLNRTTTSTKKPSNIFLDNFKDQTTLSTTSNRPSNIFLDNFSTHQTTETSDIFTTDQSAFIKRRSEKECDIQNPQKFGGIDVNGPTTERNGFPFMAILGWRSEIENKIWYTCGGILISPSYVLSAAHCADIRGASPSFVHLGDKDLTESEEGMVKIKNVIIHPNYNKTSINNDVALVELDREVNNPVACLWTQHDLPIAKYIALGYTRSSFEAVRSQQLLKVVVTNVDDPQTREMYKLDDKLKNIGIVESDFCTADVENFRHFCQGDTSGPVIMELEGLIYVVGITSFGLGCTELPSSIFTRVSSYIDWIEPIVWPEIDIRIDNN